MNIQLVDQNRFLTEVNARLTLHGETVCSSGNYFFIIDFNQKEPKMFAWSMCDNTAIIIMHIEEYMKRNNKKVDLSSLSVYR